MIWECPSQKNWTLSRKITKITRDSRRIRGRKMTEAKKRRRTVIDLSSSKISLKATKIANKREDSSSKRQFLNKKKRKRVTKEEVARVKKEATNSTE